MKRTDFLSRFLALIDSTLPSTPLLWLALSKESGELIIYSISCKMAWLFSMIAIGIAYIWILSDPTPVLASKVFIISLICSFLAVSIAFIWFWNNLKPAPDNEVISRQGFFSSLRETISWSVISLIFYYELYQNFSERITGVTGKIIVYLLANSYFFSGVLAITLSCFLTNLIRVYWSIKSRG